jgi:hypothetical protein
LLKHYPPTWDGLLQCYAAGVPFFRGTLSGDLVYTVGIFAAYAIAAHWSANRAAKSVLAPRIDNC